MTRDFEMSILLAKVIKGDIEEDKIREQVSVAAEKELTDAEFESFKELVVDFLWADPDTPERIQAVNNLVACKFLETN